MNTLLKALKMLTCLWVLQDFCTRFLSEFQYFYSSKSRVFNNPLNALKPFHNQLQPRDLVHLLGLKNYIGCKSGNKIASKFEKQPKPLSYKFGYVYRTCPVRQAMLYTKNYF